ncbi:periostin-like [Lineus longissimus]|uniref:periostin-like n=1 Tax=Lineus longissimus TaxID=88925 RepID=UPI002B4C7722
MRHFLILISMVVSLVVADGDNIALPDSNFTFRDVNYVMPWLKGPNMCAYYLIPGQKGIHGRYYSECLFYQPKLILGKQATIEYECCFGFKAGEGKSGCRRVDPLENVVRTTNNMGLTSFPIQQAGLTRTLSKDGAFTVFVPTNEAIDEAERLDSTIGTRLAARGNPLIRYHMHKGRLYTNDIVRNQMLAMEYAVRGMKEKAILHKYCNGIITINCARIIMPNREASNGIVHVIDKVIEPIPDDHKNVMRALQSDDQYSEFVKHLEQVPGLSAELAEKGPYTILAPTDQAFKDLDPEITVRLKDKEILGAFIKFHIIPITICSASVLEEQTVVNMNNKRMKLGVDAHGRLSINGQATVTTADIVTWNGVIHIIDRTLLPDFILGASALAGRLQLNTYVEYLRRAGLEAYVNGGEKRTLFIPSETAWSELSATEKQRIASDPEYLKLLMQYHIVKGQYKLSDVNSQTQFKSETSGGASLSLNRYRAFGSQTGFAIQGAEVTSADYGGGNVMIHIINKVLLPPKSAILDFLKTDERFSIFYDMIVTAKVDNIIRSLRGEMTFILPTNKAFEQLDSDFANELKNNRHLAKVIRYHIWPMVLYTSSFYKGWTYYVRTHLGEDVEIHREFGELLLNHRTHVEIVDISMIDGSVAHIVDEVLRCRCP